jgi:carboxypeptidase C (cathepsin A)
MANILFLESPRNVGFSYGDKGRYDDHLTTTDNADALVEFLKRFPEYRGHDFYVTGESYGGVYVPRLVEKIIDYMLESVSF